MSESHDIAVVGATGIVGEALLDVLTQRKFPIGKIYALASSRSVGKQVDFGNRGLTVQDIADFDFSQAQIGLFSAGASVSEVYAPI
ncbi:MAG: aspartate-semialdehyde dehydrogenase, partial [Woeseiaceae bacterium]